MTENILEKLKILGLRVTPVRKQIIYTLTDAKKPISASDLLSKIKANKTTIYREIEILLKKNYLNEVDFADGTKRYELSSLTHHHHLICVKCHKIEDVVLKENLQKEEIKIEKTNNFKILKHNLEFFGLCHNCI